VQFRLPALLRFLQLLWAVTHALDTTSKRMARELGITGPQRLVLRLVGLFPGIAAGELSTIMHVHPSTLTGVLRRLVDRRLLERVADRADSRRAVLRLKPLGTRLLETTRGTAEAAAEEVLRQLSRRERLVIAQVLMQLAERLSAHTEPNMSRRRA